MRAHPGDVVCARRLPIGQNFTLMNTAPSVIPPPPPLATGMIDRINFAIMFEKYREVLFKRWWIIAICLAVSLIGGGYKAYRQPDIFLARGGMMVQPRMTLQSGDARVDIEGPNFYGTQLRLMQSKRVKDAAQTRLKDYADTFPSPPSASLSASVEKNTSIFALTVTSTSAEYARRYLDAAMNEFINYKQEIFQRTIEDAEAMLGEEQANALKERKKASDEVFRFQRENNMPAVEAQRDMATQYLMKLQREYADKKTEMDLLNEETYQRRMDRDSQPNRSPTDEKQPLKGGAAAGADQQSSPSRLRTDSRSQKDALQNQIFMLNEEREALSKYLRPSHPKIKSIDEESEKKARLLALFALDLEQAIAGYRQSLIQQQEALKKSMAEWEKLAFEANKKASDFERLKATLNSCNENYDRLEKQIASVRFNSKKPDLISISEPATASPIPIGPNRNRDIMLAGIYGLLAALGLIVVLERFDDRVKTIEDLQNTLAEAVLGQVPLMAEANEGAKPLLMSDLLPHSTFSEAFRSVRSSFMFSPMGEQARSIAVTSAIPGDGKTTCAVNFALCLAQIEGGKTLLIDADMRKMNVHRYFKMENGIGLSEVLSGQATCDQGLVCTGIPNLDIMRAGSSPPNPGELILSQNFKDLMVELGKHYKRIVIDTPPILATDDALSLAPNVDGVIFVVKANQTSLRYINRSLSLLKQRGATIFGMILNWVDTTTAHYYYYYYYSNYYNSHYYSSNGASRPEGTAPATGRTETSSSGSAGHKERRRKGSSHGDAGAPRSMFGFLTKKSKQPPDENSGRVRSVKKSVPDSPQGDKPEQA